MKEERAIMAFLIGLAVLLAFVALFAPIKAKAAVCAMNGANPVQCTSAQEAHLKWLASLDATTTPAVVAKTGSVKVQPVKKEVKVEDMTRAQKIALLQSLIKQLQELLASLKK